MVDRRVRIFVGKGESPVIDVMAEKRARQGWVVSRDSRDKVVLQALKGVAGKSVVVEGAQAGFCVREVVEKSLANGAVAVKVDLKKIFWSEHDPGGAGKEDLVKRVRELGYLELSEEWEAHQEKVTITPRRVWNKHRPFQE